MNGNGKTTSLPDRSRARLRREAHRIKRRVFYTLTAFGIGAASTWLYKEEIFSFLLAPAGGNLSPDGKPIFTAPVEMMSNTINLAIKGGLTVAFPVAVFFAYRTMSPLMTPSYRRFMRLFLATSALAFLSGAAFAYYVLLPTGLGFLLDFGTDISTPYVSISSYLDLFYAMIFWLGIVFELPIVMYLLSKTGVVPYQKLKAFRKFVPVTALIFSAILTPTFDVVNQLLLAGPMVGLYEIGMFAAWAARPEDGDYLWVKAVKRRVLWVYRKILAVLKSPYTVPRWAYRKVRG